ncbi:MAG: DUF456 domain-containing protein, partial [Thiobacillus sp.]
MIDPVFQVVLWLLAALLIVLGFAGLILPVMPGIPLVFAGLVLLAWAENFVYVGWMTLTLLGLLALVSYGVDFLASALGAKKFGASPRAVAGAALGALAGLFFGLVGIVLGPFVGAVIGEFSRKSSVRAAAHAGVGATLGLLFGVLLKIALAFAMIGVFVLDRWCAAPACRPSCSGLCHDRRIRAGPPAIENSQDGNQFACCNEREEQDSRFALLR